MPPHGNYYPSLSLLSVSLALVTIPTPSTVGSGGAHSHCDCWRQTRSHRFPGGFQEAWKDFWLMQQLNNCSWRRPWYHKKCSLLVAFSAWGTLFLRRWQTGWSNIPDCAHGVPRSGKKPACPQHFKQNKSYHFMNSKWSIFLLLYALLDLHSPLQISTEMLHWKIFHSSEC